MKVNLKSQFVFWWVLLIGIVLADGSDFKPEVVSLKSSRPANDISYFDDSSNVLALREGKLSVSFNDGKSWEEVKDTKDADIIHVKFDPFNHDRAVALTSGDKHFVTNDRGKSFSSFKLKSSSDTKINVNSPPMFSFHAKNKDLGLIEFYSCPDNVGFGDRCDVLHFYTKNGFKSDAQQLSVTATSCTFAKSSKLFDKGNDNTIFCSVDKLNSFGHVVESRLIKSNDFFKTATEIDHDLAKNGKIIDVRVEQNFLIAVVQNDKFNKKSKVSLLISKDAESFDEADLKVDVAHGVMTFLDSSPSSLFLAVMDFSNAIHKYSLSTIYSSDSSGLKFKKVLDRVQGGAVQKVQTIDGVWLANTAEKEKTTDNKDKSLLDLLIGGGFNKNIRTKVSLNDGREWSDLKINNDEDCKIEDGCSLHVLTPAERDGEGKFVTGPTPGIVFAVGSKGDHLDHNMKNMHTYISRDGGATWDFTLDQPALFAFGDLGNVILAIPYYSTKDSSTDKFYYSLDQGKTWKDEKLEFALFPLFLTTTIDGTSTKFLLSGLEDNNSQDFKNFEEVLYYFDFSKAFDGRECDPKNDFEEVYARVSPETQKPVCVYGHKEKFQRRKQDAKCFVNKLFDDVKVYDSPCECTESDFECGVGFKLSSKNACVPDKRKIGEICAKQNKKEVSLPDKVLIADNKCNLETKKAGDFVATEKFKCSEYIDDHRNKHKGAKHDIVSNEFDFDGELDGYSYLDETNDFRGENIIVKTRDNRAYISNNGGFDFTKVPIGDEILAYYVGPIPGQVILLTNTQTIYVSVDGGNSFKREEAPTAPTHFSKVISFDRYNVDKFIWFGREDCEDPFSSTCKSVAHITKDGGSSFKKLYSNVRLCDFVSSSLTVKNDDNKDLIYCSVLDADDDKLKLLSSNNDFRDHKTLFENIVGYANTENYVMVATVDQEKKSLKAKVTIDGSTFADADFPHGFDVDVQQAYTVLDSTSGAIFLHVTTINEDGLELGAILKSNSNGTSYVLSLDNVNRNRVGYVDYDRIDGLEGVIIANTVNNPNVKNKKLKTQITHNDGGEWNYLPPPAIDSKGKKFKCNGQSLEKCSLNLHGFTERADYRDTYSSTSAVGLMIGVGNVGEVLKDYNEGSTFLTRDGGLTWKEVKKGVYMWEYGDRGTILVLVNAREETDKLSYSLDEGETWHDYKFAHKPIKVLDLATVPSDTSRKFTIFGHTPSDSSYTISYSVDFTNVYKRQCQLDLDNPDNDDYEYWSPKHPLISDNCLFGHEAMYLRRAIGHDDCFIGSAPLAEGFKVLKNCSCTRKDFECDYNYFRDSDDTCKLVKGLSPSDRKSEFCKKENAFEYFEPTGYRKIPLSTCVGGKKFDSWNPVPCPGKQKEFNKHYGRGVGVGRLILLVGIPLAVFFFATYFVYDRGIRRNGGFKRFGQIRLDEEDDFHPIENNDVDKVVNKIVKGGIYTAAITIAAFKTLRKIDRAILDRISSSLFRRSPGRRAYVQVPDIDEEEELFGNFQDNHEEELEEGAEVANFQSNEDENDISNDISNYTRSSADVDEEADHRLFGIDDQSDEESQNSQSN